MAAGIIAKRTTRNNLLVGCLVVLYLGLQLVMLQEHWASDQHAPIGNDMRNAPRNSRIESQPAPPPADSQLTLIDLDAEIAKGRAYANSIQNLDRQLAFVHIPKAAGSAIEEVAGVQAKLDWGSCLFRHKPKRPGGVCRYPPEQFEWPKYVGWWHLPPSLFPLMGTNPYDHADLFVVVRNVTERLISEFYYACRKRSGKECDASRMNDPAYLNEWLKKQLVDRNTTNLTAKDYLDHNGHFTSQYDFVVSPMGVQMVDYVIRMEALNEEFPALMQAYGLDIHLPNTKTNTDRNHTTDLGTKDINEEVLQLIRDRYQKDFEMLESLT